MSINRNNTSETPKKAALYVRVSTNYQIDRDSLPMQRQELITYAQLMFGINDYVVFEDAGYSGKNTDRPEFQNMMRRIRAGEFTHLLCWKIDRISRNLLDFASMYQELKDLGVTFVSKNEQFDTSTAIGEAMLKIILVFAELERNMTSERVTAQCSPGHRTGSGMVVVYLMGTTTTRIQRLSPSTRRRLFLCARCTIFIQNIVHW
jgi:DNA invertase Pin-like site-specific DNA recombinase